MKFEKALARCVLRLLGIHWKDLDEVFLDIMYVYKIKLDALAFKVEELLEAAPPSD
jgi:hypothetical protein